MAALEPKQDSRGRYYRNLGYISPENRQQPKLFLGKDKVEATARLCRLVQLWEYQKSISTVEGEPSWGPMLPVARAIGNGETVYRWPKSKDFHDVTYAAVVNFIAVSIPPVIAIEAEDQSALASGEDEWKMHADAQQAIIDAAKSKQTIYALLASQVVTEPESG